MVETARLESGQCHFVGVGQPSIPDGKPAFIARLTLTQLDRVGHQTDTIWTPGVGDRGKRPSLHSNNPYPVFYRKNKKASCHG